MDSHLLDYEREWILVHFTQAAFLKGCFIDLMPTCVTYCRDTALPVGLDLMISRGPFQLLHFHDSITYFEQIKNKTKNQKTKTELFPVLLSCVWTFLLDFPWRLSKQTMFSLIMLSQIGGSVSGKLYQCFVANMPLLLCEVMKCKDWYGTYFSKICVRTHPCKRRF